MCAAVDCHCLASSAWQREQGMQRLRTEPGTNNAAKPGRAIASLLFGLGASPIFIPNVRGTHSSFSFPSSRPPLSYPPPCSASSPPPSWVCLYNLFSLSPPDFLMALRRSAGSILEAGSSLKCAALYSFELSHLMRQYT